MGTIVVVRRKGGSSACTRGCTWCTHNISSKRVVPFVRVHPTWRCQPQRKHTAGSRRPVTDERDRCATSNHFHSPRKERGKPTRGGGERGSPAQLLHRGEGPATSLRKHSSTWSVTFLLCHCLSLSILSISQFLSVSLVGVFVCLPANVPLPPPPPPPSFLSPSFPSLLRIVSHD